MKNYLTKREAWRTRARHKTCRRAYTSRQPAVWVDSLPRRTCMGGTWCFLDARRFGMAHISYVYTYVRVGGRMVHYLVSGGWPLHKGKDAFRVEARRMLKSYAL